ncbi:MAG: AGE family epimerase/isomerase [Chitinophagaceae bacterium]|nr:AGE family epimerase/isomerase [Chitinophagaceae bacterium]
MLYDNALLINVLSEAYQITKNELYATSIRQTIDWMHREMRSDEGGFLSALDADSEGVEGKFYTWSKNEIDCLLGEDSELYCQYYDITDNGNWEHTNILWITKPFNSFVQEIVHKDQSDLQELERQVRESLERSNKKLFDERSKRIRPGTDDKILLSWNALMITALCKAYAALGDELFKELAVKNMDFLEKKLKDPSEERWLHTYKNGIAKVSAFLEDYAYLVQAYIHLQEVTGKAGYLQKARELTQFIIRNFKDDEEPFFYFTHKNQVDVIVRKKEVYDGATPSGNSIMAVNLLYLAKIFDENSWAKMAERMICRLEQSIVKHPTSFGIWASGLQWLIEPINEIAIIGDNASDFLPAMLKTYLPNKVLQAAAGSDSNFPLLTGKSKKSEVQIYLCKNYACLHPVSTVKEIFELINTDD